MSMMSIKQGSSHAPEDCRRKAGCPDCLLLINKLFCRTSSLKPLALSIKDRMIPLRLFYGLGRSFVRLLLVNPGDPSSTCFQCSNRPYHYREPLGWPDSQSYRPRAGGVLVFIANSNAFLVRYEFSGSYEATIHWTCNCRKLEIKLSMIARTLPPLVMKRGLDAPTF